MKRIFLVLLIMFLMTSSAHAFGRWDSNRASNQAVDTSEFSSLDSGDNTVQSALESLDSLAGSVQFSLLLDGGGSAIAEGEKDVIYFSFPMEITSVTMATEQTGDISISAWKDTYANYPPTAADWITGAATPTITTSNKSQDTTLTGWTTTISAGDVLKFNVESVHTVTRCTITFAGTKI